MDSQDSYRVQLDEDWGLNDLYQFPHALSQCYAFIYCLDYHLFPGHKERIDTALREYPWRGGYSYVNIYTVLGNQVPLRDRPKVKSIQKASPGWLDLYLNVHVACQLAGVVVTLAGAVSSALTAYKQAQKILISINEARRKAGLQKMRLTADEAKALNQICTELAKNLGFKSLKELHERTGDPEVSLKLLMGHYRRLSVILDYEKKGKAKLTLPS